MGRATELAQQSGPARASASASALRMTAEATGAACSRTGATCCCDFIHDGDGSRTKNDGDDRDDLPRADRTAGRRGSGCCAGGGAEWRACNRCGDLGAHERTHCVIGYRGCALHCDQLC